MSLRRQIQIEIDNTEIEEYILAYDPLSKVVFARKLLESFASGQARDIRDHITESVVARDPVVRKRALVICDLAEKWATDKRREETDG